MTKPKPNVTQKVLIVDDHILFREGLVGLLQNEPGFEVVGQSGTASEAIRMALELKPDLILLDLVLPDEDGIKTSKAILSQLPDTKIIILSITESDDLLITALLAGAKGYLGKNVPFDHLLASLRGTVRGELALPRASMNQVLDELFRLSRLNSRYDGSVNKSEELTSRETEILDLLGQGASNREIAEKLCITENTVKIHVSHILEKLQVKSRFEAGKFARRRSVSSSTFYENGKNDGEIL